MLQVGAADTKSVDKSLLHKSDSSEILLSYPPNLLRKPRKFVKAPTTRREFTSFRAALHAQFE